MKLNFSSLFLFLFSLPLFFLSFQFMSRKLYPYIYLWCFLPTQSCRSWVVWLYFVVLCIVVLLFHSNSRAQKWRILWYKPWTFRKKSIMISIGRTKLIKGECYTRTKKRCPRSSNWIIAWLLLVEIFFVEIFSCKLVCTLRKIKGFKSYLSSEIK